MKGTQNNACKYKTVSNLNDRYYFSQVVLQWGIAMNKARLTKCIQTARLCLMRDWCRAANCSLYLMWRSSSGLIVLSVKCLNKVKNIIFEFTIPEGRCMSILLVKLLTLWIYCQYRSELLTGRPKNIKDLLCQTGIAAHIVVSSTVKDFNFSTAEKNNVNLIKIEGINI